jgi:lactate dehydrogenase-like 2-hydroxyacid dehydrogenase
MLAIFLLSVKRYSHINWGMATKSRTKFLYGMGAFGYGSIGQTMGSFLMFFGTAILGIPGVLMGIAVGLGTVVDASTDPLVGHVSDFICVCRGGGDELDALVDFAVMVGCDKVFGTYRAFACHRDVQYFLFDAV